MLSHICLRFKTEGLKQQETLDSLPKSIRSSIANHLFFRTVQDVHLFKGVSADFLFQLACLWYFSRTALFSNYNWKKVSPKKTWCKLSCNEQVSEMQVEYFPPKEDVVLQNDAPSDLYIIVSGSVVSNTIVIRNLRPHLEKKPGFWEIDFCGATQPVSLVAVILQQPSHKNSPLGLFSRNQISPTNKTADTGTSWCWPHGQVSQILGGF